MLDLDNFKTLIDKYGHAAGDQALVKIVSLIKRDIRNSDVLEMYGGEEFIV